MKAVILKPGDMSRFCILYIIYCIYSAIEVPTMFLCMLATTTITLRKYFAPYVMQ